MPAKIFSLRKHGASRSNFQRHEEKGGSLLPGYKIRGYNYKMTPTEFEFVVENLKKYNWEDS